MLNFSTISMKRWFLISCIVFTGAIVAYSFAFYFLMRFYSDEVNPVFMVNSLSFALTLSILSTWHLLLRTSKRFAVICGALVSLLFGGILSIFVRGVFVKFTGFPFVTGPSVIAWATLWIFPPSLICIILLSRFYGQPSVVQEGITKGTMSLEKWLRVACLFFPLSTTMYFILLFSRYASDPQMYVKLSFTFALSLTVLSTWHLLIRTSGRRAMVTGILIAAISSGVLPSVILGMLHTILGDRFDTFDVFVLGGMLFWPFVFVPSLIAIPLLSKFYGGEISSSQIEAVHVER